MSLKQILLILLSIKTFNSSAMEQDSSYYKVVSTRDCIKHIEANGLTIYDDSQYRIKSTSGLVYLLPKGEVVLIPTNFDLEYPGIVFNDLETFKHYAERDFFPIGEDEMTWLERYNNQIKQFRKHPDFYSKTLTETLRVNFPFKSTDDIKSAFLKIQSIVSSSRNKNYSYEHENIIYSFGLGVINYLIDYKGYELILRDGYENYNPITNLLLKKDEEIKDVLTTCFIFLDVYDRDAIKAFMKSIDLF